VRHALVADWDQRSLGRIATGSAVVFTLPIFQNIPHPIDVGTRAEEAVNDPPEQIRSCPAAARRSSTHASSSSRIIRTMFLPALESSNARSNRPAFAGELKRCSSSLRLIARSRGGSARRVSAPTPVRGPLIWRHGNGPDESEHRRPSLDGQPMLIRHPSRPDAPAPRIGSGFPMPSNGSRMISLISRHRRSAVRGSVAIQ
jgi:hypothetical protein